MAEKTSQVFVVFKQIVEYSGMQLPFEEVYA